MSIFRILVPMCAGAMLLTSCATEIVTTTTTIADASTTTTSLAPPEGDIIELLDQLDALTDGLGQDIVDGNRAEFTAKYARAQAILAAIEPQIRATGIDLVEDVARIVDLIRTATERKRPADADKAKRFLTLIRESVPDLLAERGA